MSASILSMIKISVDEIRIIDNKRDWMYFTDIIQKIFFLPFSHRCQNQKRIWFSHRWHDTHIFRVRSNLKSEVASRYHYITLTFIFLSRHLFLNLPSTIHRVSFRISLPKFCSLLYSLERSNHANFHIISTLSDTQNSM